MYIYEFKTDAFREYTKAELIKKVTNKLGEKGQVNDLQILKRSLDGRKKSELLFQYKVSLIIDENFAKKLLKKGKIRKENTLKNKTLLLGNKELQERPVIIGSGPAGLFCAYKLAKEGFPPIIIERGEALGKRIESVKAFTNKGIFNKKSNIQFGEGGAGTFSDGKLTSRSKNLKNQYVLDLLANLSGDEKISYVHNPHLGTDGLRGVLDKMRQEIESLGGSFYFESQLTELEINEQKVTRVFIDALGWLNIDILILALGHSARDTFRLLEKKGFKPVQKIFSVGFRIEHPRDYISYQQYGLREEELLEYKALGPGEYHLRYSPKDKRNAYSFCMCPGGIVVPASSEEGQVVTNGMSYKNRNTSVSNSAIVTTVYENDVPAGGLGGMAFQEALEKKAFLLGGSNYHAIGQNAMDFLERKESSKFNCDFKPTYQPGITLGDMWAVLPEDICDGLKAGLEDFENKIPGFIGKGFITGVETRTSSPVRFERDEEGISVVYDNVYLCGEGAGYAGGIMSSAIDGLTIGENIMREYKGVKLNG